MINFVLYEMSEKARHEYELIVLNFVGIREEKFKIFDYYDFSKCNNSNNIYIISDKDFNKTLTIASDIRNNNDWKSQIIIVSNLCDIDQSLIINKLLILDYIDINSNYADKIKEDLFMAYKILSNEKTLCFCLNSEVNKIPYNDILYIEKDNNQNYCTIVTTNDEYTIKSTITFLEKELDPAFFMKTHRSCIVNLHNIECYNCQKNSVSFIDGSTIDLVSRDKKQILKSRLIEHKIAN